MIMPTQGCSKAIIAPISWAAVAAVMCVALAACSSAVSGRSADLAATAVVDEESPAAGAKFTLSVTVRNVGTADASATTLRYFLSNDATITTAGTEMGTDTVVELAAVGSSSQSVG